MPDTQAPAGGVSSSVTDVARWVRMELEAGKLDGKQLIAEDALAPTHTPQIVRGQPQTYDGQTRFYGLGWNVENDHLGYLRWSHSGAFSQGAATTAVLLPEHGLGVVVLTNGMPLGIPEIIADEIVDQIAVGKQTRDWRKYWHDDLFSHLFVEDPALSEVPSPATAAKPDDAYVGSYANSFYGTFGVVAKDGGLALVEGPAKVTFPLTHWDADTFTYISSPELPKLRSPISFTIGADGKAASIDIGDADGRGLGTLTREP
jgi:hypothetical protein